MARLNNCLFFLLHAFVHILISGRRTKFDQSGPVIGLTVLVSCLSRREESKVMVSYFVSAFWLVFQRHATFSQPVKRKANVNRASVQSSSLDGKF